MPHDFELGSLLLAAGPALLYSVVRSNVIRAIGVFVLAMASGCGGSDSSHSAPPTSAAELTISIPTYRTTLGVHRRALSVSGATKSASFTVGGTTTVIPLTPTSPDCTTTASGRSCSIAVGMTAGAAVPFEISTYASDDGTGAALSTVHGMQTILADRPNAINVTLDAIVAQLRLGLTKSSFIVGQASTSTLNVNVLDAAGAIIAVGANNLVDTNDNPVTITLADSEKVATTLSPTTLTATPPTLSYNGGAGVGASTITATASSSANPTIAIGKTSFTIGTNAGYVGTVNADGPVAYYRLNETGGTAALDASGNNHTAQYVAGYKLGQGALLAGDASANSVSYPSGYTTTNATWANPAVTAECWIKPTAADVRGAPRIMDNAWSDHDGNGFMLWLTSGTVGFNAGWNAPVGTIALAAGKVYHVVGTYDQTTGATLYINGLANAHVTPGAVPSPQSGDYGGTTYIGVLDARAGGFGLTNYFQGQISDCALYDHALTPAQIANHYNVGANAHVVPAPIPTVAPTPTAPPQTPAPAPITYNATSACISHVLYTNNVLPTGEGEFATNGLDRAWWGRARGNPLGGNQYSGFQVSWGRNQYDTYFGDVNDGISTAADDPFYVGPDTAAPGSPKGVRISAFAMPAHLVGNPKVNGASWYSGVLDTPINQQYGFFVARVRVPAPAPGLSPAFWMLSNNGMPTGTHGPINGEWDVQEMFGNDYGNGMNAGNIAWNSGSGKPQNWGGVYTWTSALGTIPSSDYHDYGVLLSPGGAAISSNYSGAGGPGLIYGPVNQGVTNFLDGVPLYGHTGGADLTQGVSWKELMAMFQVAPKGSWLGSPTAATFPSYYWIQWIRVYKPTKASC